MTPQFIKLVSAILYVLLSRPQYVGDQDRTVEARTGLLQPVAVAIASTARNENEVAALMALGEHETGYAELVLLGRCSELPKGQQCDNGKAMGPWQLHREACREAWDLQAPVGSEESLRVQARCALRLLRFNAERGKEHTLTPMHAAFCGYAARSWEWKGADKRVQTARELARRLHEAKKTKVSE